MARMTVTVAIVTGASRGIGEAIARGLAASGAAVAITARTAEEGDHRLAGSLATTAREIQQASGTALPVVADISKQADRERLVATVEREVGPIDNLVNNAGVTYFQAVAGFPERHFEVMFAVQVRAPFELAQRVLPGMRERRRGWILNISSRAAIHPAGPPYTSRPGSTVYGMCKAALERFTTGLAAEVYPDGVAVNVLSPSGLVPTPCVVFHGLTRGLPPDRLGSPGTVAAAAFAVRTGGSAPLPRRVPDA